MRYSLLTLLAIMLVPASAQVNNPAPLPDTSTRERTIREHAAKEMMEKLKRIKDKETAMDYALDFMYDFSVVFQTSNTYTAENETDDFAEYFTEIQNELERIAKAGWFSPIFKTTTRFTILTQKIKTRNFKNKDEESIVRKLVAGDKEYLYELYLSIMWVSLKDPESFAQGLTTRAEYAKRSTIALEKDLRNFKAFNEYVKSIGDRLSKEKKEYKILLFLIEEMENKNWFGDPNYKARGRALREYLEQL